ncbi:MAG: N-6 DNA methylase, partial [Vallitaleaceae bacterium]|nr:N-6 DNA methylase [Vallitaleaceae bacterium]
MNDVDLGQVFTNKSVAEYMTSLFCLSNDCKILDPCFGEGAFIAALLNHGYQSVEGYEIDASLYCAVREKYPNLRLHNRDFLTTNSKNSYDGIIMNPPYIRQEKINHLAGYGITKKALRKLKLYDALPSTANLYMYFIVKAIDLLQPEGELVVIFPSSWLNARSGQFFKEYLYSKCTLLQQVHISGEVFEKNALVEVVILKLQKGASLDVLPIVKHIDVQNGALIQKENDKESVNLGFKMHFNAIAKVRRGLTTGYNKMFINPPLTDEESKTHFKEIL